MKHKTIDSVTMIEIDDQLIDIVKTQMPFMSDCMYACLASMHPVACPGAAP